MGEVLPFKREQEHCQELLEAIGWQAVGEVAERYGTGYEPTEEGYQPGTVATLAYHNMQHTLRVRVHSVQTAEALGLCSYDQELVRTIAGAHDIVHGGPAHENEQRSADWLVERMHAARVPDEDIVIARLAIVGTEPVLASDGSMVGQYAAAQAYPSERARLIALSVAIGDMADLYAPYGPLVGHELYQERQGVQTADVPPMHQFSAFQQKQLALLRNYRFPHAVGEELFASLRDDVIAYQTQLTEWFRSGVISTWEQVMELDAAFAEYQQSH